MRAFLRAALFGWMTPLFAARSSTDAASLYLAIASSTLDASQASMNFFTIVLLRDSTERLYARLRWLTRILFSADRELAIGGIHPLIVSVAQRVSPKGGRRKPVALLRQ